MIENNAKTRKKYSYYKRVMRRYNPSEQILSFDDWYQDHLIRGKNPNNTKLKHGRPDAYARLRYARHKAQAKFRNIPWEFDYTSWCQWWLDHGSDRNIPSAERGKDRLCMARYNDEGAYNPDNVYLATHSENTRDAARAGRLGRPVGSKNKKG